MGRVYLILDIVEGKHIEAVLNLRASPSVRWLGVLEGQWDIITAIEASNRMRMAKHLVRALATVETITEDLRVLPACDGYSMESKAGPVGTVKTDKAKNSKQARYGRYESNIPSSV